MKLNIKQLLLLAGLAAGLAGCRRPIMANTPAPAPPPAPAPQRTYSPLPTTNSGQQIIAAPAPAATNINISRTAESPKVTIAATPRLPPTEPVGTIELSGFHPLHRDPAAIKSIRADHIATDPTGKMTLSGDAVVEVQEGQATAKYRGDFIAIQTGPGFNPQVKGGQVAVK